MTVFLLMSLWLGVSAVRSDDAAVIEPLDKFSELVADVMHGPVETGDARGVAAAWSDLELAHRDVMAVELPASYADVASDFDHARVYLTKSMRGLDSAIKSTDSAQILMHAIEVHHAASRIDAALRGMCYEVVLLHDAIAPIQHRALPDENWEAIKAALPTLQERIDALSTAEVPAKHAEAEAQLRVVAADMQKTWLELKQACAEDDSPKIAAAFGRLHDHFHDCMVLFR